MRDLVAHALCQLPAVLRAGPRVADLAPTTRSAGVRVAAHPEFGVPLASRTNSTMISSAALGSGDRVARGIGVRAPSAPRLADVLLWILLLALLPASARADAGGAAPDCEQDPALSRA